MSRRRGRIELLAALSTLLANPASAADCPYPTATEQATKPTTASADINADIDLSMDTFEATKEGTWHLDGNVGIKQGDRELKTTDATYDPQTQDFQTEHPVEYTDPSMQVKGKAAQFNPAGEAAFEDAQFELHAQSARGEAQRISLAADGALSLEGVRYTTCPIGSEDWLFKASDIDINRTTGVGTGRNVRLDFKGIPILYAPFISFPVGNERKSGFLFPTFGTSSSSGTAIGVPWYWNIAPNYDATFLPTWYSNRGLRLDTEFRYLTSVGHGEVTADYLPDDQRFGGSRNLVRWVDQSDFSDHWRLNLDAANVSDTRWFEDFGLGPEATSISYIDRLANITYLSDDWFASLRTQNFQTIDTTIPELDRPYTLLPQLDVRALLPEQPYGLTFALDGEYSNFVRSVGTTGMRLDVEPQIRMPLRGSGIYLEPAASWRYTAYSLQDVAPGEDRTPSRSLPIFSLDGGMTFERPSGSHDQRVQTLEPRLMYLYVPYRNQDNLPDFDTGAADLNLVQLFRTNRYVGADRVSDANQLSVGVTSRLLDADTGQQFISATIGQAYYFTEPRVALPGETLDDKQSSDIIAELDLKAYRDWNVHMGVQWDPGDKRSERSDIHFQYQPAPDRVVNLGYRFRRDNIEQVDGSVAWPVGKNWSAYGRLVYSLEDDTSLDQFAGFEYRACCWRLRAVARRYVRNRDGATDNSFLLQLELNGLSNVGVGADAFLERSIQGYSLRPASSSYP
ncbi:MAG TPA: LPS assembly protein LptD [Steroidobacteraceae bacterium]|jgi:LPS-assembly protein